MARSLSFSLVSVFVLLYVSVAQSAPPRFHWEQGQVLTYKVDQETNAVDKAADSTVEARSKLALTKQWHVLAVDAEGVATLELKITAMRFEVKGRDDKWLVYDSAKPEETAKEMKDLDKYQNSVVAVLRVDSLGKVVEVKEAKFGQASSFDKELPFVVSLPDSESSVGKTWDRKYQIALEPPQGTGEKFDATQVFHTSQANADKMLIDIATTVAKLPESPMDQIPVMQSMTEGQVLFDSSKGRMEKAKLHVDKEVKDHRGKDSSYHFQTSYTIKLTEN